MQQAAKSRQSTEDVNCLIVQVQSIALCGYTRGSSIYMYYSVRRCIDVLYAKTPKAVHRACASSWTSPKALAFTRVTRYDKSLVAW